MPGFHQHNDRRQQRHQQAAQGNALGNRTLEGKQQADQVGLGADNHGGDLR
ncbi:hypothetical protein D3C80_1950050 [compost metagenome]